MKAIILGSTGMIGKSVLLECLQDDRVTDVLLINRTPLDLQHSKVTEVLHTDFFAVASLRDRFAAYDTCFFCMGVSSVGMKEDEYRRMTYDLTLNFARTLASVNQQVIFCYVSGAGTDSTGNGKAMWARVKGRTENALLGLGFKDAYMFRPGYIQPLKGVKAKSGLVNTMYVVFKPLYLLLRPFPALVTDSVSLSRAMINAAFHGYPRKVIGMKDIAVLSRNQHS